MNLKLPRTSTLNGRFKWGIGLLVGILLSLAIYAHYLVKISTEYSLQNLATHRDADSALKDFKNSLQRVESAIYQYNTLLTPSVRINIQRQLTILGEQAAGLQKFIVSQPETLPQQQQSLPLAIADFVRLTENYLSIMQNVESRYPGMPIMLTYLEPTNRRFSEAIEQALNEGDTEHLKPNVIEADHYQVMQVLHKIRFSWAKQVSWLRVFVANRMGAFGDPQQSMHRNLVNRRMHADEVRELLKQLEQLNQQGKLGLQQQESLQVMQEAWQYYDEYVTRAVDIYLSESWRADIQIIKQQIEPALGKLWKFTELLENNVRSMTIAGYQLSQNTSAILSQFTWLFTATIILVLIGAYIFFSKKIRKPILQLSTAMAAEAIGESCEVVTKHNLTEVDRLVDSFTYMKQQVHSRQRRLESILDNAAEGIITLDEAGLIETFNSAAQQLFGYETHEAVGQNIEILSPGKPQYNSGNYTQLFLGGEQGGYLGKEREIQGRRKDGSMIPLSIKVSEMQLGGRKLYTAIVDDISERRAVIDHLRQLAEHDSLTGLYNRKYFMDALERAFIQAKRDHAQTCACIYIDLDNFKYINDTLGHLEGDRLLIGLSNVLATRTRRNDILARLGGDEFALLMLNLEPWQVAAAAENYRQAIANFTFITKGKHIDTGCSIGVAIYEEDVMNKECLLSRADIACHMAKRAGRNHVHVFEHKDKDRIDSFYAEMGWTRRIRHALENDQFVFSCQPILNVYDRSIFSHELLLRMVDSETGEYIMPSGFLDAAERFGLMPEIDRWVVQHAFHWMNEQSQDHLNYFINLSGKSIGDKTLLEFIKQLTPGLNIATSRIAFEITEDVAIAELDKARIFLNELKHLGFKTALDDFGVGYSSFSYLRELDVDFVKIDGSFINSMHTDEMNFALVKAINEICHILGKQTIAEYVQNDTALALLKSIGVDYAQGYNIATAEDFDQNTIQFSIR